MTKTATKSDVLKLARKKWPNFEFEVRHDPQNKTMDQIKADAVQRMEEIAAIKSNLVSLGRTDLALIQAARFTLDVNGDEPSWSQLKTATANAERVKELRERRNHLELQRDQNVPRIEFLYRRSDGFGWSMIYADDWSHLLQQIEAKP